MFNFREFNPGDAVYYTGEKFKSELTNKDGQPLKGWIHSLVENEWEVYVVDFPDAKDSDYVMPGRVLSAARPSKMDRNAGPDIQPRRQRLGED